MILDALNALTDYLPAACILAGALLYAWLTRARWRR